MDTILEKLSEAVEFGKSDKKSPYPRHLIDQDGAKEWTEAALAKGIDPQEILEHALIPAMDKVGTKFSEHKIFVPQMLMSAKAMGASMVQLKPYYASGVIKSKGTFIIGTVKGDLHDIGKNLVSMIVEGGGWKIIDLGVNVPTSSFIEKISENPDAVVGLSALLTTTMVNMEDIVKQIRENYPKTKVLIGGAPVNNDFCQKIGADYYASDPQEAVSYLNKIVS